MRGQWERDRERKNVQEEALRKLTRYLQLWLPPSHGISSISGQMQGRECSLSNEIIYLWKPTPAPGPKPIYQVWAAGGSGPGAINLPPVFPPVLHHAPLPLIPLLGLAWAPLPPYPTPPCPLPTPCDNNHSPPVSRQCKATQSPGKIIQIQWTRDTVTNLCPSATALTQRLFVSEPTGLTSGTRWVEVGDAGGYAVTGQVVYVEMKWGDMI